MAHPDLDHVTAACGIIVDPGAPGGFRHLATAWSVAEGEWVTTWQGEELPPASARLLTAHGGVQGELANWEIDGAVTGFTSIAAPATLTVAQEGELHKRMELLAVAYPCVIDHDAFRLHRGSLDAERYHPYLCPWRIAGHLALFTKDEGFVAGACYPGMQGGPVLDQQGAVVGVLLPGRIGSGQVPLARFHRFI